LTDYIRNNRSSITFPKDGHSWVILSGIEQRIKEKIERIGTPLKDWDIHIYRGILTGCNEAFIIDKNKRDELIKISPNSAEIIRPILRGRDIKRYGYEFADKYIIATFPSRHYDIDDYPAIRDYLLAYGKEKLEQTGKPGARKKTTNKWFETQDTIGYWEDFSRPKIMYSEIVQEPQFYFDKKGDFFPEATTFIMTGKHLDFLYDLLHTNTVTYFFKKFYAGGGLGETGYRYKKAFLECLPVPQGKFILNKTDIEQSVYELYNLTSEEIAVIQRG
jgi:hypothetical protein